MVSSLAVSNCKTTLCFKAKSSYLKISINFASPLETLIFYGLACLLHLPGLLLCLTQRLMCSGDSPPENKKFSWQNGQVFLSVNFQQFGDVACNAFKSKLHINPLHFLVSVLFRALPNASGPFILTNVDSNGSRLFCTFLIRICRNLVEYYYKCCILIGYATHYLFVDK